MADVLTEICTRKREWIAQCKQMQSYAQLESIAKTQSPPRGFMFSLLCNIEKHNAALIAEVKKASPSQGVIRADFNPVQIAQSYEKAGAAAISVLTDAAYFQGSDNDLVAVRNAVALPILRKDFMLDEYQITQSRALGADCVLLIMAALEDAQAQALEACAQQWGMDVLVEVHTVQELERALKYIHSPMLGINHRNLKTLKVDLEFSHVIAPLVPKNKLLIGESGIATPQDIATLQQRGMFAYLVGESLIRQANIEAATRALLAKPAA